MRRPHHIAAVPRMRSVFAPAAWLVAAAILLQTSLGLALGLRMAGYASDGEVTELCVDHAAPADDKGEPGLPSGHGHRHDQCVLCQGAVEPLFLAAASAPAPTDAAGLPAERPLPDAPPPRRPPLAYASRAPPAVA